MNNEIIENENIVSFFKVDGIWYANNKELLEHKPDFYNRIKSKPRAIISKYNIPNDDYIYATKNVKQNKWTIGTSDCKKAQLLISKKWVDKYYYGNLLNTSNNKNKNVDDNAEFNVEIVDVINNNKYKNAPSLIKLNDDEKFKDVNGDIIDIETRGEKTESGVYFKLNDIAKKMLDMDASTIRRTLTNITSGYKRGIHYDTFNQENDTFNQENDTFNQENDTFNRTRDIDYVSGSIKNPNKNTANTHIHLYITYKGLCRILFTSHNKNAIAFQDWAVNKLFTIQMGTKIEKNKLAAKLCGVTISQVNEVFKLNCAGSFSCIYLISLGLVKDLRETFNIDKSFNDNLMVYKFGFTMHLDKRLLEHNDTYGKLNNVKISVIAYQYIDNNDMSNAESEIRIFCKTFELKLNVNKYNELIVLNNEQLTQVKTQYKYVGKEFGGTLKEMILNYDNYVKKTECEILKNNHKIELLQQELIMANKEKDMANKEKDMANKEKDMANKEIKLKDIIINLNNELKQKK